MSEPGSTPEENMLFIEIEQKGRSEMISITIKPFKRLS